MIVMLLLFNLVGHTCLLQSTQCHIRQLGGVSFGPSDQCQDAGGLLRLCVQIGKYPLVSPLRKPSTQNVMITLRKGILKRT